MKLAVAVIHGMGSQKASFAEPLIEELEDRFADAGEDPGELVFEPIYWAPVLLQKENTLWGRVTKFHDLDYTKLRRFVVNALGDAIAYQPSKKGAKKTQNVYDDIHAVVRGALRRLAQRAGEKTPLVILAHSLGSIIISNYLWDLWKTAHPVTPLEGGETLAGLVTFGSPIALWSLRYDNFGTPIPFPHPKLKTRYPRVKPQWLNFFDEDDILAYPLKNLNPAYRTIVTKDIPISVGGFFTGWNPLAHTHYWTDNDFTKPVAKLLRKIWADTQP
ncbi:MAG: chemotaxis protein [Candidatus Methylomirabilales bacterium]